MESKHWLTRPILATLAAVVMLATLVAVGRSAVTNSSSPIIFPLVPEPAAATIEVGAWPEAIATGRGAVWACEPGLGDRVDPGDTIQDQPRPLRCVSG